MSLSEKMEMETEEEYILPEAGPSVPGHYSYPDPTLQPLMVVVLWPILKRTKTKGQYKLTLALPSTNEYKKALMGPAFHGKGNRSWAIGNAGTAMSNEFRDRAELAAKAALQQCNFLPPYLTAARCLIQVYYPDRRRRDVHNTLFKPALDGFTRAGVWKDDNLVELVIPLPKVSRSKSRVEFWIYPLDVTGLEDEE